MRKRLLVSWQHNIDVILPIKLIANINRTSPRIPKYNLYAFLFQRIYK